MTVSYDTGGTSHTYTSYITNSYTGGLLTSQVSDTYKDGTNSTADAAIADTRSAWSYVWWDGALQNVAGNDIDNSGSIDSTTTYSYDSSGHVASAVIADGRARTVTFTTDQSGMIVDRDEADSLSGGDPRTLRYFYAGQQMGETGNNGTANMSYAASVHARLAPGGSGAFTGGSASPSPPKGNSGCAVIGQILLAAIAVAVTIWRRRRADNGLPDRLDPGRCRAAARSRPWSGRRGGCPAPT